MRTMMVETSYQIRTPSFVYVIVYRMHDFCHPHSSKVDFCFGIFMFELSRWRIFETTMPEIKEKIKRMILRQDGLGAVFDV